MDDQDKENHIISSGVRTADNVDSVIWEASPTQWINLGAFILYGSLMGLVGMLWFNLDNGLLSYRFRPYLGIFEIALLSIGIFFGLVMVYRYLKLRYTRYVLTGERLIEYEGITKIFQTGEPLELYDVYDHRIPPAYLLAFVRRGNLTLFTNDKRQPIVNLVGIKNPAELYENIRYNVERLRLSKKGFFNDRG